MGGTKGGGFAFTPAPAMPAAVALAALTPVLAVEGDGEEVLID